MLEQERLTELTARANTGKGASATETLDLINEINKLQMKLAEASADMEVYSKERGILVRERLELRADVGRLNQRLEGWVQHVD